MTTRAVLPPQRTSWAPVAALGLAMLMVTSEMTIPAVTLPGMGADLGVSAAATAWVLLAYALPSAAVSVPAGRWADGADVRAVFALAMIGLGLASVLVGLAPTSTFTGGLIAFLLPYFVADVLGDGPDVTGVALLFVVGAMAPVSPLAGLLPDRYGTRAVAVVGSAVTVVAMLSMLTLDAGSGVADLAWRLVLLGVGSGLFNRAINTALLVGTPAGSEGVAGGLGMTVRTIAMTVAPAVTALAWTVAGGGAAGFRAGVVVVTAAVGLGLLVRLVPALSGAGRPAAELAR